MACCPAGHQLDGARRSCPRCSRDQVVELAAAADQSLPRVVIESAVDAVVPAGLAMSRLASALADPGALASGAPPLAGRLAAELITRGSALIPPACARCARGGRPLYRTPGAPGAGRRDERRSAGDQLGGQPPSQRRRA